MSSFIPINRIANETRTPKAERDVPVNETNRNRSFLSRWFCCSCVFANVHTTSSAVLIFRISVGVVENEIMWKQHNDGIETTSLKMHRLCCSDVKTAVHLCAIARGCVSRRDARINSIKSICQFTSSQAIRLLSGQYYIGKPVQRDNVISSNR